MKKIILENFRCFRGRHEYPIKPLTFLVGENSTGKTSFLAAIRLASDLGAGWRLDFKDPPFDLGVFDQIATYVGGKSGRARYFSLGQVFETSEKRGKQTSEVQLQAKFEKSHKGPQPELLKLELHDSRFSISFAISGINAGEPKRDDSGYLGVLSTPSKKEFRIPVASQIRGEEPITIHDLRTVLYFGFFRKESDLKGSKRKQMEVDAIMRLISGASGSNRFRPFATAPIRTKPERSYDPFSEELEPGGKHAIAILARLLRSSSKEGTDLFNAVCAFGKESGLFREIHLKGAHQEVNPFELTVKIAGRFMNIVDVGYGVSQVLPILIDALRGRRGETYLLQQPEVHLHPTAQAELGSLFGILAKRDKKTFIVETHSDYILDRVRLEIQRKREGFVRPEDVVILYFQRENGEVRVYPIEVDDQGNLSGQPAGYRQFFLNEMRGLMGV